MSPAFRYMLAAALSFSVMSATVKVLSERLPLGELVFFRAFIALGLSYVMLRQRGIEGFGARKDLLILRGVLGLGGLSCFFYAIMHLPLAEVTVLHFSNPLITSILGALILKELFGPRQVVAMIISMAGVVLVAQPEVLFGTGARVLDGWGITAALVGAFFSAGAYITVRKLGETEDPLMVVFYFPLLATPITLPWCLSVGLWPTPKEWALLVLMGLATQAGQVFLTRGLHAEAAGKAMGMSYVQIIFATLWGWVLFADVPNGWSALGAVAIVGGTWFINRTRRPAAVLPLKATSS